jgi:hypothetical protein
VFLNAPFKGLDLANVPDTLSGNCGRNPGNACRLVWDVSHNGAAARLTAVYLAGPVNLILRLAWLVLLALLARALVHRLINRITDHAADAPLATRLRQGAGARAVRLPWLTRRAAAPRRRPSASSTPTRPSPRLRSTRRPPNGGTSARTPSGRSSAARHR